MEEGRGQQTYLNLVHLNLPNSASSSLLISSPYDSDAFFNHPFMINNINSALYTTSSSLVAAAAAPEICPSSHVDPACSLIINSNIQIEHVGLMGGAGKRRRKMTMNKDAERGNNGEVIHVRAKRGQATDSHSIAERVRREKINEKLKALQHLVPGCYKTMGLAVMLDVIINYVQSLQNQIEFLSMKLSAASMFYDFNSPEAEAMEALQRTNNNNPCEEAGEMERMMMVRDDQLQGFDPLLPASSAPTDADADADHHHHLQSTWPF